MNLSFLQQIFSEEITKTIISNIVGGILALLGAYFSIKWQSDRKNSEQMKMYNTFYLEQIESMSEHINKLVDIFENRHIISFQHIDQIHVTMDLVNKHSDGFIFIQDKTLRKEVRKFFFDCFYDAQRAKSAHIHKEKIERINDQESDQQIIKNNQIQVLEAFTEMKSFVLDLKNHVLSIQIIKKKLEI